MAYAGFIEIALLVTIVVFAAGILAALKSGFNEVITALQAIHDTLERRAPHA